MPILRKNKQAIKRPDFDDQQVL